MVTRIEGTEGDDWLGAGVDYWVSGNGGNDTIEADVGPIGGPCTIGGNLGDDLLKAFSVEGKTIRGGPGFDTFLSTAMEDGDLVDLRGPDRLIRGIEKFLFGAGTDTIYGTLRGDVIDDIGGDGRIYGRPGNDTITAEHSDAYGAPKVFGGVGDDLIARAGKGKTHGGLGNDTITQTSTDGARMYGDEGADTFVFGDPFKGRVKDFEDGVDKLDLSAYFGTFEEVADATHPAGSSGALILIRLDGDGSSKVFIEGINQSDLTADDVIL